MNSGLLNLLNLVINDSPSSLEIMPAEAKKMNKNTVIDDGAEFQKFADIFSDRELMADKKQSNIQLSNKLSDLNITNSVATDAAESGKLLPFLDEFSQDPQPLPFALEETDFSQQSFWQGANFGASIRNRLQSLTITLPDQGVNKENQSVSVSVDNSTNSATDLTGATLGFLGQGSSDENESNRPINIQQAEENRITPISPLSTSNPPKVNELASQLIEEDSQVTPRKDRTPPIFYQDVMPRYWSPITLESDNPNGALLIKNEGNSGQLDGVKFLAQADGIDWFKDGKFQSLMEKRLILSGNEKSPIPSTELQQSTLIQKNSLLSSSPQNLLSTPSPVATSPAHFMNWSIVDSRDLAMTRNAPVQSVNPAFTDALNLKQDFTPNLALRIQWMFNQAVSGAEIMMDPPEMGPLSIKIKHHHGETSILFQVANASTKEALDDGLPKLREMLLQQGINLGDTHVRHQGKRGESENSGNGQSTNAEDLIADDDLSDQVEVMEVKQGLVDVYS